MPTVLNVVLFKDYGFWYLLIRGTLFLTFSVGKAIMSLKFSHLGHLLFTLSILREVEMHKKPSFG